MGAAKLHFMRIMNFYSMGFSEGCYGDVVFIQTYCKGDKLQLEEMSVFRD